MKPVPKLFRSGKTDLTDDELLLFDVLFNGLDTLESLFQENYASWHNLCYTHKLKRLELRQTMLRLVGKGYVAVDSGELLILDKTYLGLTVLGGGLWEAERCPQWETYCDYWTEYGSRQAVFTAESPSRQTLVDFVSLVQQCRLVELDSECNSLQEISNTRREHCQWRTFPTLYRFQAVCWGQGGIHADNELFFANCRWWGNVRGLQNLLPDKE